MRRTPHHQNADSSLIVLLLQLLPQTTDSSLVVLLLQPLPQTTYSFSVIGMVLGGVA